MPEGGVGAGLVRGLAFVAVPWDEVPRADVQTLRPHLRSGALLYLQIEALGVESEDGEDEGLKGRRMSVRGRRRGDET